MLFSQLETMCGLCRESAKTMQFPTLPNGTSTSSFCKENLHTFERNNEDKLKLVPFMSDRFYCTNNNELKPSRRIQSIQKKIECLRECNYLLINQIRKVCDSTYIPTKSDIEYLNKLFEVDQLHVQDLSDSLARGKKAIDRRMQDACRDSDYEKCKNLHVKPVCETGHIMVELPMSTRTHATWSDSKLKNLHNSQQCSSVQSLKGSCLKFEECHKHDLSEMEKELRRMKQRLERLNQQHECKDCKNLDFLDDENCLQCTSNCNSKLCREKSHKVVQRSRCIIC